MVTFEDEELSKSEVSDRVRNRLSEVHYQLDEIEDFLHGKYPSYQYYKDREYYKRSDEIPYPPRYSDLPDACKDLFQRLTYIRHELQRLLGLIPKEWRGITTYPSFARYFFEPSYTEAFKYYYYKTPKEVYQQEYDKLVEDYKQPSEMEILNAKTQAKLDFDRQLLGVSPRGYIPMQGEQRLAMLLEKWSKHHEDLTKQKREQEQLTEDKITSRKRFVEEMAKTHHLNPNEEVIIWETEERNSWRTVRVSDLHRFSMDQIHYGLQQLIKKRNS